MPSLRRPAGLVLAGGGSHAAWQAACLDRLASSGWEFDEVLGFSAGALNAAAYCLGRLPLVLSLWREVQSLHPLRFAPRLAPLSLFSGRALLEALRRAGIDDAACRRGLRRPLTVAALRADDGIPRYSRFAPGGEPWDGPIDGRLAATCAIPVVFPPVFLPDGGRERPFVDGGIRGVEPLSFAGLAGCRDVVVLEMVRPDELGRAAGWLSPLARLDQRAREGVYSLDSDGIRALRAASPEARVLRCQPSRRLKFNMLDFRAKHVRPAMELGAEDAEAFLKEAR